MDKVRLVSSGTEAVMTALRLARGYTGRDKIIKFHGGYHGHSDSLLVSAGSGLLTAGQASSAGVPQALARNTIVAPYNDVASFEKIMNAMGNEIAAVVEPVAETWLGTGSLKFLKALRAHQGKGALLILRSQWLSSGATTYGEQIGIKPDLTCLEKSSGWHAHRCSWRQQEGHGLPRSLGQGLPSGNLEW
jgi:glutamate-1-semialdehyde 2,1-aminomutase